MRRDPPRRVHSGLDPCSPRLPLNCCTRCERHSQHLPDDPEKRGRTILIDATVTAAANNGKCLLMVHE